MQSTLDCTSNQATSNQLVDAQPPIRYGSIRVTVKHTQWPLIFDCIKDADWYISYSHFGKGGDNEYFHVFVPATEHKDIE